MWIGIILGVIALLIIGNGIYTTVNTKNVVEYYPNGRIKLKGVTKFNERVGSFDHFDEYGALSIKMTYENGKLKKEDIISKSGGVYKTVEHYNGIISTKYFLKYAPEEIKRNRSIVLEALKNDGLALEFISTEFKNDREIVLVAVKSSGKALEYASNELKNDREIVLEAVKRIKPYDARSYSVLKFASSELKDNKEIVFTAIQSNIHQYLDASENIKKDILFLKSIFKTGNNLNRFDKVNLFDYIEEINPVKINLRNKIFFYFIKIIHSLKKLLNQEYGIFNTVNLLIYALVIIFFILLCFIWPINSNTVWGFVKQTLKNIWVSFIITFVISRVFLFVLQTTNWLTSNYLLKKWLNSENE